MRNKLMTLTPRRALGLLEIVGCLVAMAIGVWIGAQYLGVDLNTAAYDALDDSELLTQIPEDWRPVNPECPDGDCPSPEQQRAAAAQALEQERDGLRFEVARLLGSESESTASTSESSEVLLDAEQVRIRTQTIAYWQQLRDIVSELDQINARTEALLGGPDHARVVSVREHAYGYTARAVRNVSAEGVDERALEMGSRLIAWSQEGAKTFAAAAELAGTKPVGGKSVHAQQLWRQQKIEFQKRTEMVRRKAAETLVYLNGQYFVELEDLPL